ncbi:hypothetical protein TNCV_5101431, partial [Trichonephila clavipes]
PLEASAWRFVRFASSALVANLDAETSPLRVGHCVKPSEQ